MTEKTEKKKTGAGLNLAPDAQAQAAPQARVYQVFLRSGEAFLVADTRDAVGLVEAMKLGGLVAFTGDPGLNGVGQGLVHASEVAGMTTMVMPQEDDADDEYDDEVPGFEDEDDVPEPPSPVARGKLKGLNFTKRG